MVFFRRPAPLFLLFVLPPLIHAQTQAPLPVIADTLKPLIRTAAPVIAITHVTLFDGTGSPAQHDRTILLRDGVILSVTSSSGVSIPSEAQVIDGHDKTLLPGLVGMHEHMFSISASGGDRHLILGTEQAETAPPLYLAAGITTARTTGSIEPVADLALKTAIDSGRQAGPALDVTGPYLDGAGTFLAQDQPIKSATDARQTVDYWADRGVTSFKAYMFIPPDALKAAIDESHRRGFKITGHLCSVGFTEAVNMGIDNLEHGLIVDTEFYPNKQPGVCPRADKEALTAVLDLDIHGPKIQGLIDTMIQHHVALTSTLAVFESTDPDEPPIESLQGTQSALSPLSWMSYLHLRNASRQHSRFFGLTLQLLQKEMDFEREFVRKGGLLMAGCDPTGIGGVIAGYGDQRSLELLIKAGFTPAEAVSIYSQHGARFLGRDKTIGTVEAGKQADLLLLDGDFEHDASAIRKPEIVFKNGIGWDSAKLQASVAGIAGQR